MSSIFTKIINGEIPCHKVAENDRFLAFLDIFPKVVGHTLVIPKIEVDRLWDLDSDWYADIWTYSREVALMIEKAVPCNRVGVQVEGLEVPHAHIHLIPLSDKGFAGLVKPDPDQLDFAEIARRIAG